MGKEKTWYQQNYCEAAYYSDCEDFDAYTQQQAAEQGVIQAQRQEGIPHAKLLVVIEVLPNETDRLSPHLRETFTDRSTCSGVYEVEFAYSVEEILDKLLSWKPDLVLIHFDSLYRISYVKLIPQITASPCPPKAVLVFGMNLEAADKERIEQLGVSYVDHRQGFKKVHTTIKQIALELALRLEQPPVAS